MGNNKSILTFQVLLYNEHSFYSRNRSIGMSYLNRFIIEEKAENECLGVFKDSYLSSSTKNHFNHQLQRIPDLESESTFLHFIRADGYIGPLEDVFDSFNVITTRLSSERITCIQNEKYKKYCKRGVPLEDLDISPRVEAESTDALSLAELDLSVFRPMRGIKSVGDGIDDFFEQIEFEKHPFGFYPEKMIGYPEKMIGNLISFHLSLLTLKAEDLMNRSPYQNFKRETRLSKSEQNYALSYCSRISFTKSNWFSVDYHVNWIEIWTHYHESIWTPNTWTITYHEIDDASEY